MTVHNVNDLVAFIEKTKLKESKNVTVEKFGVPRCSVTFFRQELFDIFSHMVMYGYFQSRFSITFSVLPSWNTQQMKNHFKQLFSERKEVFNELWGTSILKDKVSRMSDVNPNYYDLPFTDQCSIIAEVANQIFTSSYLANNLLSQNQLIDHLTQLKEKYATCDQENKFAFRKNELIIRWEEYREDIRVILLIDVLTMRVELTYANDEKTGVLNPLTEFIDYNFAYERYFNFQKRHDLLFLETQGEPMYPLAHNNIQELRLTFSVVNEDVSPLDIWARSARTQGLWLKKLLKTLHLFCPMSDEGKGILPEESECIKLPFLGIPIYSGKSNPTSYSGVRMYTAGLWRIYLQFDTSEEQDDYGQPFKVNFIAAQVEPFCQNHDAGEGSKYYHPLIYDWGK